MSPSLSSYPLDSKVRRPAVKQTVRLEALRHVGLFKGVSKRSLVKIDQMSEVRAVGQGEVIVAEGESGSDTMVVLVGTASVARGNRKVAELTVGQVFGEMALLDRQPRSATVTADEPMHLLVIHGAEFRKLLTKVPGLADSLLATLSRRLREADAIHDF